MKNAFVLFIAEAGHTGRAPFASGTVGTLVAVVLYFFLRGLPAAWYIVVCVLVTGVAIWAAGEAEKLLGTKDPSSIVIDEVAGYLISMILLPFSWGLVISAFFLFRLFDIIKPWPLNRLQDMHGGPGIVLDDVGAGVYTNIVLQAAVHFIGKG